MRVLIVSGFYLPGYKGGGPIKTLSNLSDCLGAEIEFQIITSDRDLGDRVSYPSVNVGEWNSGSNASVFYLKPGLFGILQILVQMMKADYDLVYLNSFFSIRYSFLPLLVSRVLRKKIILAPRGELSKGALSIKYRKKAFFLFMFKFLGIGRGVVFQGSTALERAEIRHKLGASADARVAENVAVNKFPVHIKERKPGPLRVVFVSRISEKKNLLYALHTLKDVCAQIRYDIYGPIEDSAYWEECEAVIARLPPNIEVVYRGGVEPKEVMEILQQYDLFYFPTKGENFGHVIVESFCAGLPVLLSDTTPWRNLESLGVGWDIALAEEKKFSEIIDYLATVPDIEYLDFKRSVLLWAKNRFSQQNQIDANLELFRYALSKERRSPRR